MPFEGRIGFGNGQTPAGAEGEAHSGGSDSGARKIRSRFFNRSLEVGGHRRLWSRGVTQVEP